MARKAKGKRRLWSDIIENVEPTSGYIPFSQAAFWLATKGGTSRFDLEDSGTWKLAYDQLLKRIESGEVEAIGRRRGHGTNEIISGHTFSKIKIAYPCRDTPDELLFGTFPYIQCYGPVDDDHWQRADGFDDKLFATGHTAPEWTHLQVKASDLARYWPFQDATANTNTSTRAGESVPLKRPHKRGGCKPTWDQEEGIQFLCEEFDKRGHFDDTGQTSCWDRQRYAEDALIAHLSKHSQSDGPSRSWARRTVKLACRRHALTPHHRLRRSEWFRINSEPFRTILGRQFSVVELILLRSTETQQVNNGARSLIPQLYTACRDPGCCR